MSGSLMSFQVHPRLGWPYFRIQSLPILEESDSGLRKASQLSEFQFPNL